MIVLRISHLLFLLFYLASVYTMTQERSSLLAAEVEHSCSRPDSAQFDDACANALGYPNYQRVKPKPGPGFLLMLSPAVQMFPEVTERAFHVQAQTLKRLYVADWLSPRAPPFQA